MPYFYAYILESDATPGVYYTAFIALSRQRHKVIFKILTTEARYDKKILIARHLERLEEARGAAA